MITIAVDEMRHRMYNNPAFDSSSSSLCNFARQTRLLRLVSTLEELIPPRSSNTSRVRHTRRDSLRRELGRLTDRVRRNRLALSNALGGRNAFGNGDFAGGILGEGVGLGGVDSRRLGRGDREGRVGNGCGADFLGDWLGGFDNGHVGGRVVLGDGGDVGSLAGGDRSVGSGFGGGFVDGGLVEGLVK